MSGRGLGHTGGTIDKLESFSGISNRAFNGAVFRSGVRYRACASGSVG